MQLLLAVGHVRPCKSEDNFSVELMQTCLVLVFSRIHRIRLQKLLLALRLYVVGNSG